MRPILPGARGPAVEDVQRRLLKMGFDLGPTGVDGVFLGLTQEAVTAFQGRLGLLEDGVVGQETWSALVDSTFTLGDRTLYLRLPYFHGHDVLVLQEALSALGFSCGAVDSIFGASTEHAVRAFQRNSGHPADGIAGLETAAALMNLKHVWEGKSGAPSGGVSATPVRSLDVLRRIAVVVQADEEPAQQVAERLVNLARASARDALIGVAGSTDAPASPAYLVVLATSSGPALDGLPVALLGNDEPVILARRLNTALSAASTTPPRIGIDLGEMSLNEEALQRAAVRVLDAICVVLA